MLSPNEQAQAKRRKNLERLSITSQFLHLIDFALRHPTMLLEKGALITSIDIDVGSRSIGEANKGENDVNVHEYLTEERVGEIEESTIPLLIEFFDSLEIPVTFAIRGQLIKTKSRIPELLLKSPIKHDIAAHGYSHKTFTSLSTLEAQSELELISSGMKKLNINPKSFVFPKNKVGHLCLLERFGYECYRGEGGLGIFKHACDEMQIRKQGRLFDIRPGFHLGVTYNPLFIDKIIDISIRNKVPFHLWFHPRDIYETRGRTIQSNIHRILLPIYRYAKTKERTGELSFETMHSVIGKINPTCSLGMAQ